MHGWQGLRPHHEGVSLLRIFTAAAPGLADGRHLESVLNPTCPAGTAPLEREAMNVQQEVLRVLDEVLSMGGRSAAFARDTPLLGAIPELDSMAVVSLLTTLEERLGISVDDGDIDGSTFASVGSLVDFVAAQLDS